MCRSPGPRPQGGLSKLEETKVSVQKMSADLEEAQKALQKAEADCDSLLTIIQQEKRIADEKRTQVCAAAVPPVDRALHAVWIPQGRGQGFF